MKEYLLSDYMEAVERPMSFEKNYYIPHLCVRNQNSSTTKLRVVFDATSKSDQGYSLNDTLLVANDPVQDFRLKTVTFGVSSSPHAAIRTLLQLAEDERSDFPNASGIMYSDIYVDDVLTSSDTLALQSELVSLLSRGGFQLRKWSANHQFLLNGLPPEDCQQSPFSFDNHDSVIKILGMNLSGARHRIVSLTKYPLVNNPVPSGVSEIVRLFDPVGLVCPITFLAKYLIHHLWSSVLAWDETPPSYVAEKW
ncbi:hypothetical protein JTB14_008833 [Gonioctena quinquepunctata]|nr:hypothetical protein JTB14_008833 [Gonioctena quinquepunctata]